MLKPSWFSVGAAIITAFFLLQAIIFPAPPASRYQTRSDRAIKAYLVIENLAQLLP